MGELAVDIAKCDREIERLKNGIRSGEYDDNPGGALLGLHDWMQERNFIMEEIRFAGGATSSPCPRYELIPLSAMTALAGRYERGIRLRGDGAWNALSRNQKDADNPEFVINRLGHAIKHIQKAIAILSGTALVIDDESVSDGGDAGAILFAGALLAEYEYRRTVLKTTP